jgi:hypothetical protein
MHNVVDVTFYPSRKYHVMYSYVGVEKKFNQFRHPSYREECQLLAATILFHVQ